MILEEKSHSASTLDENASSDEKIKSALAEYFHQGGKSEKACPAEFVKRLETVVEHIKGLQEPKSLYKINNKMETEVKKDLKELELLMKEMRAVLTNIWRLQSNQIDVHKEMNSIKGAIDKKSKEEVQEMETVIAIYDKDLLKKWHVAKKTSAPASLENFIANLAGKKQAIEHVYKLASDRLATLKKNKTGPTAPPTFHMRFSGSSITAKLNDNDSGSDTDMDEQFSLC